MSARSPLRTVRITRGKTAAYDHADALRSLGAQVITVALGDSVYELQIYKEPTMGPRPVRLMTPKSRLTRILAGGEISKRPTLHTGRAAFHEGKACPNCGHDESGIEDNGCRGVELTYLCTACGHQWDANLYADGGGAS